MPTCKARLTSIEHQYTRLDSAAKSNAAECQSSQWIALQTAGVQHEWKTSACFQRWSVRLRAVREVCFANSGCSGKRVKEEKALFLWPLTKWHFLLSRFAVHAAARKTGLTENDAQQIVVLSREETESMRQRSSIPSQKEGCLRPGW